MNENKKQLWITLSSGCQLKVNRICLFPEIELLKAIELRTKAQELIGGQTSGIGFLGSPGWVLGSAAVLSVIESITSNSKAKKGMKMLENAAMKNNDLKNRGQFFEIELIDGISEANPAAWQAKKEAEVKIDVESMGFFESARAMGKYNITDSQLKNGQTIVTTLANFVYDGDEFIWLESEDGMMKIRWSYVEIFRILDK